MAKYRKKPVVIDAWQWDETTTMREMLETLGMQTMAHSGHIEHPDKCTGLRIGTLEGTHIVSPGDYIIKGVAGEFYPCKPDIFNKTYEMV